MYSPTLNCQYRIRGGFKEIPFEELAVCWKRKSIDGMLLDLYHAKERPQGSRIVDVDAFVERIASLRGDLDESGSVEAPPTIAGIRLEPSRVERLDLSPAPAIYARHSFVRINSGWRRDVLVP